MKLKGQLDKAKTPNHSPHPENLVATETVAETASLPRVPSKSNWCQIGLLINLN